MKNDPNVLTSMKNSENHCIIGIRNEKGKSSQSIWCYPEYKQRGNQNNRNNIGRPISTEGEDFDDMMTDERIMS
jgi:hypothetical protein